MFSKYTMLKQAHGAFYNLRPPWSCAIAAGHCFYRAVGLRLQLPKRKSLSIESETRKLFIVKTGPHSSIIDESGIDQA